MQRSLVSWLSAVLFAVLSLSAWASESLIEEIVVTAQKREQGLQDTPLSVTAFSGDTVEQLGMYTSTDITAQTPNFTVGLPSGDTGVPALYIRGVGLSDYRVFTPSGIASYVDEVYVAQSAGQIFQLLDLERVEVLRGPQGTLYGRNATGGAVNYISRKPTEQFEGWVRGHVGSFGFAKVEGAVGGPITESLGFRFTALKADSDGWLNNEFTGNDQQGMDEFAWRALLQWDATENLDILLNVRGGDTANDSVQFRQRGVFTGPFSFVVCEDSEILANECVDANGHSEQEAGVNENGIPYAAVPGYDEGNYNLEGKNDTSFWGASLKADWQVGNVLLTSITAYDELDDFRPEETDASPNRLIEGVLGVDQQTFAQELRITGQRDNWSWLAGLYYLNDEASDRSGYEILPQLRPDFIGVDDPDVCADEVGIGPPPGNPSGFCPQQSVFTSGNRSSQETTSLAVYGDASIGFAEAFTLNVGLRYTDEKVERDILEIYNEPAANNPVRLQAFEETSFDNVSGRAILDWRVNDSWMLYGGVSTGFKGGGIDNDANGVSPFDAEEIVSFEGGFKSTLADGRVRLNGALFYYDYTDLQVFTFVVVGAQSFNVLSNASDAEIKGGELEFQWLPTDNTFLNIGVGYLDAEYKDFIDTINGDDFSGNRILLTPEWSFNGLLQQDFPLGEHGIVSAQIDFSFQDDVFFDAQNNALLGQDAYWLWNARLSWMSQNEALELAAWVRNIGDEEYQIYAFDLSFLGFNIEMLGMPRAMGMELTYRF